MQVSEDAGTADIKKQVAVKLDIPIEQQRLIHRGKPLPGMVDRPRSATYTGSVISWMILFHQPGLMPTHHFGGLRLTSSID